MFRDREAITHTFVSKVRTLLEFYYISGSEGEMSRAVWNITMGVS